MSGFLRPFPPVRQEALARVQAAAEQAGLVLGPFRARVPVSAAAPGRARLQATPDLGPIFVSQLRTSAGLASADVAIQSGGRSLTEGPVPQALAVAGPVAGGSAAGALGWRDPAVVLPSDTLELDFSMPGGVDVPAGQWVDIVGAQLQRPDNSRCDQVSAYRVAVAVLGAGELYAHGLALSAGGAAPRLLDARPVSWDFWARSVWTLAAGASVTRAAGIDLLLGGTRAYPYSLADLPLGVAQGDELTYRLPAGSMVQLQASDVQLGGGGSWSLRVVSLGAAFRRVTP